jgi:hypothetical protein
LEKDIVIPVLIAIAAPAFSMGAIVAIHSDRIGLTSRARLAIILLVAATLAIELAYAAWAVA